MAAARGRMNEITRAALEGAGIVDPDGGYLEDAGAKVVAIHVGIPAAQIGLWSANRVQDAIGAFEEAMHAADARGDDGFDPRPIFAGLLTQAFLMGWLVRDEQEKRG